MDDVKQQLQRSKKENHDLEEELRGALFVILVNIASDYITENATDHKDLQRRFAEISEVSCLRLKSPQSDKFHSVDSQ